MDVRTALLTLIGHSLCLIPIIYAFVFSGNSFRAEVIYVSINALNAIRRTFFTYVLRGFQTSGELLASVERIVVRWNCTSFKTKIWSDWVLFIKFGVTKIVCKFSWSLNNKSHIFVHSSKSSKWLQYLWKQNVKFDQFCTNFIFFLLIF